MEVDDKGGFREGLWWCEMNFFIINFDVGKGKIVIKGFSIFKGQL